MNREYMGMKLELCPQKIYDDLIEVMKASNVSSMYSFRITSSTPSAMIVISRKHGKNTLYNTFNSIFTTRKWRIQAVKFNAPVKVQFT